MLLFYERGRQTRLGIVFSGWLTLAHCIDKSDIDNLGPSYTTKAFGPIMAKAAALTIVEAENIVPVGSIDPNDVDLPGIFVNRIVPATAKKNIEILKLREPKEDVSAASNGSPAIIQRNRIAKRAAKELKQGYYVNLGVGMLLETSVWTALMLHRYSYTCTVDVA